MDEVLNPVVESISQEPVEVKEKFSIKKFIDRASWIALFVLTPLVFIVLLSQNAIPGDFLYPVKRGVETTVLAAASINPSTKAAFSTTINDTRFNEAQKLLLAQADTAPLTDLVSQVQSTQVSIANVSDPVQQQALTVKAIAQIDSYQAKLNNTVAQVQQSSQSLAAVPVNTQVTSAPVSQAPISANTVNNAVVSPAQQVQSSPSPSQFQQTTVVVSPVVTSAITPSPTSVSTQTVNSNVVATVTPIPPQVAMQGVKIEEAVNAANIQLEQIKVNLKNQIKQDREKVNQNQDNSQKQNNGNEGNKINNIQPQSR